MSKVNVNKSSGTIGRPKPLIPKAGFTQTRRRYGEGGRNN